MSPCLMSLYIVTHLCKIDVYIYINKIRRWVSVCIYIYTRTCLHIYMVLCIYTLVLRVIYIYMHIYIYIHTHICLLHVFTCFVDTGLFLSGRQGGVSAGPSFCKVAPDVQGRAGGVRSLRLVTILKPQGSGVIRV